LPSDRRVDRFQYWNASEQFVYLEEDKEFRAGIEQVKDISNEIMACAHKIDSGNLRYERKV
jgi:hypothetical protein